MAKKKTRKTTPSHTTDEVKRYIGSLAEDFQHKVSAIGEQFGGLDRRFDHIEVRFDRLEQKVDQIGRDVAITKSDINVIKADLKRKVDYDEFQVLVRRVAALEHRPRK